MIHVKTLPSVQFLPSLIYTYMYMQHRNKPYDMTMWIMCINSIHEFLNAAAVTLAMFELHWMLLALQLQYPAHIGEYLWSTVNRCKQHPFQTQFIMACSVQLPNIVFSGEGEDQTEYGWAISQHAVGATGRRHLLILEIWGGLCWVYALMDSTG